jgi:hypothetical protein
MAAIDAERYLESLHDEAEHAASQTSTASPS